MRVMVADDSVLLREGIARLLADEGFDVLAQCGTADELSDACGTHSADVAIVDIRMPPTHTDEGLRAAIEIRRQHREGRGARAVAVRRARPGRQVAG